MSTLAFSALSILCTGAQAQVYKCRNAASGKIEFSGTPCDMNSTGGEVRVQPNVMDSSGSRAVTESAGAAGVTQDPAGSAQAAAGNKSRSKECTDALRAYEIEAGSSRKDAQAISAARTSMTVACGQNADLPNAAADQGSSRECTQARRSYEIESGSIRKDPDAIAAKRSAMFVACGQAEPRPEPVRPAHIARTAGVFTIQSCDTAGCWDTAGNRYSQGRGQTYVSPSGASCQLQGMQMHCN
ncbi:DUF4124 domain-containing protein [Uliginosibacterium paludis]|uniref:DUF4124 domain-containing protein n=1 Tax=Uliginosibacterium paludis TaxID=1615952 RepID=A0ABV2CQV6_9RHOO